MPALVAEPFRGCAVVRVAALGDPPTAFRAYAASVVDVDPATVATDQSAYLLDPRGSAAVLRVKWSVTGAPTLGAATSVQVECRRLDTGTAIGPAVAAVVAGDSGVALFSLRADADPLSGLLDGLRCGSFELILAVTRGTATLWTADSRGAVTGAAAAATAMWGRGVWTAPIVVADQVATLTVGGAEPTGVTDAGCTTRPTFARGEHINGQVTLLAAPYEPLGLTATLEAFNGTVINTQPVLVAAGATVASVPWDQRVADQWPDTDRHDLRLLADSQPFPTSGSLERWMFGYDPQLIDRRTAADSFERPTGALAGQALTPLGVSHTGHQWIATPTEADWNITGAAGVRSAGPAAATLGPVLRAYMDAPDACEKVSAQIQYTGTGSSAILASVVARYDPAAVPGTNAEGIHARLRRSAFVIHLDIVLGGVILASTLFPAIALLNPGRGFLTIEVDPAASKARAWFYEANPGAQQYAEAVLTGPQLAALTGRYPAVFIDRTGATGVADASTRVMGVLADNPVFVDQPEQLGPLATADDFAVDGILAGRRSTYCDEWVADSSSETGTPSTTAGKLTLAGGTGSPDTTPRFTHGRLPERARVVAVTVTPAPEASVFVETQQATIASGTTSTSVLRPLTRAPADPDFCAIPASQIGTPANTNGNLACFTDAQLPAGVPVRLATGILGSRHLAWLNGRRVADHWISTINEPYGANKLGWSRGNPALPGSGDDGTSTFDDLASYGAPDVDVGVPGRIWLGRRWYKIDPRATLGISAEKDDVYSGPGGNEIVYQTPDSLFAYVPLTNIKGLPVVGEPGVLSLRTGDNTAEITNASATTDGAGVAEGPDWQAFVPLPPSGLRVERAVYGPLTVEQSLFFGAADAPGLLELLAGIVAGVLGGNLPASLLSPLGIEVSVPDEAAVQEPGEPTKTSTINALFPGDFSSPPVVRAYQFDEITGMTVDHLAPTAMTAMGPSWRATWTLDAVGPYVVEVTGLTATGQVARGTADVTGRHDEIPVIPGTLPVAGTPPDRVDRTKW